MACPFAGKYSPLPEVVSELAGRTMRMLRLADSDDDERRPTERKSILISDQQVPVPRPDQVLVHVLTAGVGSRHGADIAGVVQLVGHGVSDFQVGDKVFSCARQRGSSSYAEYAVLDPGDLFHLPDDVSFSQGAALGTAYFTAYRMLVHRAQCRPGDAVLINRASADLGVACCQLGCLLSLRVLVTMETENQRAAAEASGAAEIIISTQNNYAKSIKDCLGGRPLKAIIEFAPHVDGTLEADLKLVSPGGSIVIVKDSGDMSLPARLLWQSEVNITGCDVTRATLGEHREAGAAICNALGRGWLRPLISDEYPLNEADNAIQKVTSPDYQEWGSVIITI